MITEIFAIFDACAQKYIDPWCAPTLEFAIRGFREACETPGHQFSKYPDDYALYHVATFDIDTGVMTPQKGVKIAMASSYTPRPERPEPFTDRPVDWPKDGD